MSESIEGLLLRDPLGEVTRKERRFLLGCSLVGITLAKTGLIPTKISALGIECTNADRNALLWVLMGVILYAVVAFLFYAVSDFMAWRVSKNLANKRDFQDREELRKVVEEAVGRRLANDEDYRYVGTDEERRAIEEDYTNQQMQSLYLPTYQTTSLLTVGWFRAGFDFLLPIIIGIYAIYCLWAIRLTNSSLLCLI